MSIADDMGIVYKFYSCMDRRLFDTFRGIFYVKTLSWRISCLCSNIFFYWTWIMQFNLMKFWSFYNFSIRFFETCPELSEATRIFLTAKSPTTLFSKPVIFLKTHKFSVKNNLHNFYGQKEPQYCQNFLVITFIMWQSFKKFVHSFDWCFHMVCRIANVKRCSCVYGNNVAHTQISVLRLFYARIRTYCFGYKFHIFSNV